MASMKRLKSLKGLLGKGDLDFLPQHRHWLIILAIPVFALVAVLSAWTVFMNRLETKERKVIQSAYARADALSRNYAERLDRTIDACDRVLLHVRYDWAISAGRTKLEGTEKAGIFPEDAVVAVFVFDESGKRLTSTVPGDTQVTVVDRPYFQFHKNVREDQLLIGQSTLERLTNAEVIVFSRRVSSPGGEFNGVVVAAIRPDFLTANYSEATFGKHGYLGVVGIDREIRVARFGNTVSTLQAGLPVTSFFPDAESEHGVSQLDGGHWFSDQRSRYVSWHKVKGTQLLAMVGLDEEETLAPFRAERGDALVNATWNTLGVLVFMMMAIAFAHVVLRKKSGLESARIAYRAATEEGVDGFYINRPLRDKAGRIYDYLVVDCNTRGAELFKSRRHDLIGKTISQLYQGKLKAAVFLRLKEALEEGVHESEVKISRRDRLNATWIYYKAVRSGGDLAVTIRDISETKAHLQEMERRGNEDALTGLPNRRWIQSYLSIAIERAREANTTLALLFIDIDRFKDVNDALGHTAGDDLIKLIADRLKRTIRPHDQVVRLGGDEFVIILEDADDDARIERIAKRVMNVFKEHFHIAHEHYFISASVGVSVYPRDADDAGTLLKNADIAMYAAKKAGKGNYQFFRPQFYEALKHRLTQESELRRAVDADEFEMHYQPRVEIANGNVSSMEALVRWMHPSRGMVSPAEFIPLAEATGLILPLGELIIDKVCKQLSTWAEGGGKLIPVSINVSPRQFNESDMLSLLAAAISKYKLEPRWIQIEITESMMMQRAGQDTATFAALRDMGIHLCLDDFGTGYSSLSQLQELDFDVLKIDRSFTSRVHRKEGEILVAAMITMAHALGMKVVAEGVENEDQMNVLREFECDEVQGYLISKPVPASLAQAFLVPAAR